MSLEKGFAKLKKKLDPSRFPEMDPRFTVLVKEILEPNRELYVDAKGDIFDSAGNYLGTRSLLLESWEGFIKSTKAGLNLEEYDFAHGFEKCCLSVWQQNCPDKKPERSPIELIEQVATAFYASLQELDMKLSPQRTGKFMALLVDYYNRSGEEPKKKTIMALLHLTKGR